jgi:exodeoxyribonuclease V alpha subunit
VVPSSTIGNGIVLLRRGHRFGGGIALFAEAIQRGDADDALRVVRRGDPDVHWIPEDAGEAPSAEVVDAVRALAVDCGRQVIDAARAGQAREAIAALGQFRLLCAHRRGPEGVTTWMHHVEGWLRSAVDGFSTGIDWYAGRPLIVTENDYGLQLYNGDTGVVVAAEDGRLAAAFQRGDVIAQVSPARLAAVDTVYAMTVHKSQGSQFDVVAFLLPSADSRILTRELLYTAATRARERLILVGTEDMIRSAIERPITRASGLGRALWGEEDTG